MNEFFTKFCELEPAFIFSDIAALDPASGGSSVDAMPYPVALEQLGCTRITTLDIRADSRASIKADYINWIPEQQYDLVITNPPYLIALEYIATALDDCVDGGFVVMLLRLNFFGSIGRRAFWKDHMPLYCIVHAQRPRFNGKSDSVEYCHMVWKKGFNPDNTKLFIV
ncbi:hypothetical protein Q5H92_24670 [Hymenobacter sp. M29]|uniref:DNA methyltransferase n=1 Tax=Hymenobacter mellowenesis TaxID=3063995 RepID=A0ABT9AIC3_9BACT|nr:hypothetical protein [Hymenobacter sp. M29]MDO7849579.1 hypothetical protein [Hymenobacter sp. M29]